MPSYTMLHSANGSHFSSSKFSNATLTASITKAVKVQFFPSIAFSTSSITSFGKRMHLFVVGGIDGILNFLIVLTSAILLYIKFFLLLLLRSTVKVKKQGVQAKLTFCCTPLIYHGSKWCMSRGNSDACLMLSRSRSFITTRSRPMPKPPCGGIPYLCIER